MSEALVAKITEALDEARMGECMISASALAAIREALSSRPEGEAVANVMWGSSDEADFEKGT